MQDTIIAALQYVFIAALLPSIFSDDKPALWSSILNAALLPVLAATFASLHLWNSAISIFILAVEWLVLAIQKYRINHK